MKWTLIDNDSHRSIKFSSEKKLRQWAKDNYMKIKKSYTAEFCFYTDSWIALP